MAARNGSGFWKKVKWIFLRAVMVVVLVLFGLEFVNLQHQEAKPVEGGGRAVQRAPFVTLDNLPEYSGRSFVVLYGNKPQFSEEFKAKENPQTAVFRRIQGKGKSVLFVYAPGCTGALRAGVRKTGAGVPSHEAQGAHWDDKAYGLAVQQVR